MPQVRDRSAERDGYVGTTLSKRIAITRIALRDGEEAPAAEEAKEEAPAAEEAKEENKEDTSKKD